MSTLKLTCGTQLVPKRGRKVPPLAVRMNHRNDRCVTAYGPAGVITLVTYSDLRRNYKVAS